MTKVVFYWIAIVLVTGKKGICRDSLVLWVFDKVRAMNSSAVM